MQDSEESAIGAKTRRKSWLEPRTPDDTAKLRARKLDANECNDCSELAEEGRRYCALHRESRKIRLGAEKVCACGKDAEYVLIPPVRNRKYEGVHAYFCGEHALERSESKETGCPVGRLRRLPKKT